MMDSQAGREHASNDAVAVIGMACLFPGAASLDAYWRNILGKLDAITDAPPEAWDRDIYYNPDSTDTDQVYCSRGGFLGPLAYFDPLVHGVPPNAVGGEPDQWLALRVAREALADAGYESLDDEVRKRTAIIIGKGTYINTGNLSTVQHGLVLRQTLEIIKSVRPDITDEDLTQIKETLKRQLPTIGPDTVGGYIPNVIVGRIANKLDLMGPSFTVDAACASSLVALELAMRDLSSHVIDLALVGGAQISTSVPTLNLFCQLSALSRRQEIRPFDENADGTLLGEGLGMLVLKRLGDAERDHDRIYALVRGIGVASDGRGLSVLAPRVEGEELAIERAYLAAGIDPSTIELIEAHGTGTPVGDVTEIQSMVRVFGTRQGHMRRVAVGSVKSMIAHTLPAAGAAGLIKTALALYHQVLPPTLNVERPNPKLELDKTPFYLNTEVRPWIHGSTSPRRAGVNAFGFGGINAHAVLEEYVGSTPRVRHDHASEWDSECLVIAAESRSDAVEQLLRLKNIAEKAHVLRSTAFGHGAEPPIALQDVAQELHRALPARCTPTSIRVGIVASSLSDLRDKASRGAERLSDPACHRIKDSSGVYFFDKPLDLAGNVGLLFPGEGAQYPNMLADLCVHLPEVRETFDQMDRIYAGHSRGYVPSDFIFPRSLVSAAEQGDAEKRLWEMDGAVEGVLTANQALFVLTQRLGIQAGAIAGHSTGEYSAMRAAGVLRLDTEGELARATLSMAEAYRNGQVHHNVPHAGMLALGTDRSTAEAIAAQAGDGVYVAMDNCPHQVVLVGDAAAVERAVGIAGNRGIIYEQLGFDRPYHTPLFASYAEHVAKALRDVQFHRARVPLYTCTTGARYPAQSAAIRELAVEHWVKPVEFQQTIRRMHADGVRIFVEVGPRGNLSQFVEDILRGEDYAAIPLNVQRRSGITQLNHALAMLAAHHVSLDLNYLYENRRRPELDGEQSFATLSSTRMKLATGFPMLRLPRASAGVKNADQTPCVGALDGKPAATTTRPIPSHARMDAPPFADFATRRSSAESLGTVQNYLDTMDRFLVTQNQIMQAYLNGGNGRRSQSRRPAPQPLMGEVVEYEPGDHIVTRRTFDPAMDLYLRDHTLGRDVSAIDSDLLALSIMPLTMSLEILAEAAASLSPGRKVVGMRDVWAHRWIAVEDAPVTLQVAARCLSGGEGRIKVDIRDISDVSTQPDGPARSPAVEATVLVADKYSPAPRPELPQVLSPRACRFTPEELYGDVMFHGPSWRGVADLEQVGDDAALAHLRVLPFTAMFRNNDRPVFQLDPIVLDAAGQVIGVWAMDVYGRGHVIFPYHLEALDIFGPHLVQGSTIACSAQITQPTHEQLRSTIEVLSPQGDVWMRLVGWEDQHFEVPEQFYRVVVSPRSPSASTSWPEATSKLPVSARAICRRVNAFPARNQAFWLRVLAGCILSRAERETYAALRLSEVARVDWLLMRFVAKETVQEALRSPGAPALALADINLVSDPAEPELSGWLIVDTPTRPLALRVAATAGLAAALVCPTSNRIGLALVRTDASGAAEAAATEARAQARGTRLGTSGSASTTDEVWVSTADDGEVVVATAMSPC